MLRSILAILLLTLPCYSQTMSTSEVVLTSFAGYWANSLNTSNPTGSSVFTAKDGSQWICFARMANDGNGQPLPNVTSPFVQIAHVVRGVVTLASPVLPAWVGNDQHNACSIALDNNGFVHLSYDEHVTPLHYYKSVNPNDASSFTGPLSMLGGANETSITFALFFTNPVSGELYFTFQIGGGAYGQQAFYHYNTGTSSWEAAAGTAAGGRLANYQNPPAGATFLSGLPQWDKTTGNLWFNYQVSQGLAPFFNCGPFPNPCAEYLLGWNGTSFIKFGGAAQSMPVTFSNTTPVYIINNNPDANFTVLDSFSIDANGTFFLPYLDMDGNGFLQVYVLESSTGPFVNHQLTSNQSVFSPPPAAGWFGPGTPPTPGELVQSITAVSSGTCTWVTYADIFNWGAGQVAYQSCNNFTTSKVMYLTTKFSPNQIIFPDQVRNYRDGSISFLFQQTNDVQFRFFTFVSASTPNIGRVSLITWSPGGCKDYGALSFSGTWSEQ
jgi:hypothetical protein